VVVQRNLVQKLFHLIYVFFCAICFFFKTLADIACACLAEVRNSCEEDQQGVQSVASSSCAAAPADWQRLHVVPYTNASGHVMGYLFWVNLPADPKLDCVAIYQSFSFYYDERNRIAKLTFTAPTEELERLGHEAWRARTDGVLKGSAADSVHQHSMRCNVQSLCEASMDRTFSDHPFVDSSPATGSQLPCASSFVAQVTDILPLVMEGVGAAFRPKVLLAKQPGCCGCFAWAKHNQSQAAQGPGIERVVFTKSVAELAPRECGATPPHSLGPGSVE
jgi:hypothetical protein